MPCRRPWLVALMAAAFGSPGVRAEAPSPRAAEYFEKEVRPLLAERCFKCHAGKKSKGALKLDSRAAILDGGESGPAAVPGKPGQSLLIRAVRYHDKPKMPPKKRLRDHEVQALTRWVEMGLPWPEKALDGAAIATKGRGFHITDEQRKFWCFQPVKPVRPPAVKDASWPRSEIDRFILAALEARALKPAAAADKRTMIRRATFDLIGLPPTPAEIDAFLTDQTPDAFARVVDRLLASPHYGERWGRHWLDLVRYTDSFDARGTGGEMDIADAYHYRDWVLDALNRDMPYDRFIINQIAGDLLPAEKPGAVDKGGIVATGLLAIGNWGGGDADKEKLLTDIADDQVDVVSRTFLGLTVACARCHDHKFDPISNADYYALAGIFFSTHILPNVGPKTNGPPMLRIPLASRAEMAERQRYSSRLSALEKQLNAETEAQYRAFARGLLPQTARYVKAAWEYQNRPPAQMREPLATFASRLDLHDYALRRWIDYLSLGDSGYRLMTLPVRDLLGHTGVSGWRGQPDCPSVLANSTDQEVSILTFKLPPRSVAMHPGPTNGVVAGWKSPVTGKVRVQGRVVDADPAGGDGIAWIIDHRSDGMLHELASGDIPNGGAQQFAQGKSAGRLTSLDVKAGDLVELLVLPKANHTCDTTVVEFVIAAEDDSGVWDLTRDVAGNVLAGNPHADRRGHAGVWRFSDMADSNRARGAGTGTGTGLALFRQAVRGAGPKDVERAAAAFQKTFALADARSPFWPTRPEEEGLLPAQARGRLARMRQELETLRRNSPPQLLFANGAQEGGVPGSPHAGVHDVRIHIRGSYARLGALVPRRFPTILTGDHQKPITEGSGRLQLARWLASADHPLTARVMVNRIWQHHFGEGIVRTPSNFGKLGERPSNPQLLDWLAQRFVDSGWSIKAMHRTIMLSAAYQQSTEPRAETAKADADNRLFGRMNRRRLEAEIIRDNLLAVAGRLDRDAGGPATPDFNRPRRTVYLMTVRSDRTGFRPLFDVADSTALVDKRTVSTVAPQALFLLNHPFVLAQTRALAGRLLQAATDDRRRIGKAYELLYGRPPTAEETQIGLDFLAKADGGPSRRWQEYCQVLLCANEFIYVD